MSSTRSTGANEVVDKLRKQAAVFGNPRRIVSDRGPCFRSNVFKEYCEAEGVEHQLTTVGVPRANGQVERVNRTVIPLLTKLAAGKPEQWYRHVETAQRAINSTLHRSVGVSPFEVMFGVRPRMPTKPQLAEIVEQELVREFDEQRDEMRERAAAQIVRVQEENRRNFNRRRKEAQKYERGDLVAIRRTQEGPGLKLRFKFLGPYSVAKVLGNERYEVEKVGRSEGPRRTTTAADSMKRWTFEEEEGDDEDLFEDEETQSGRPNVGG